MQIQSQGQLVAGSVFDRLLFAYGADSPSSLATALGENLSTVKGWKQRDSVPVDHLVKCSKDTHRTLDWLITGVDRIQQPSQLPQNASTATVATGMEPEVVYGRAFNVQHGDQELNFVLIPRYSVRPSAGVGRGAVDTESQIGEIAFEAGWMRRHLGRAGPGFGIFDIGGTSMEPTLWDGETVVVDLRSREVVSGWIYLLRDMDDLLVKRLQRLLGGVIEVVSDNPAFRSQVLDSADNVEVIGRVVWPRVR